MTVTKLDDGQYRVDIRPQGRDGKRHRKTFKTRGEAKDYERWCIAKYNNKDWIEKPTDRRPLSDLIEIWWKVHGVTGFVE